MIYYNNVRFCEAVILSSVYCLISRSLDKKYLATHCILHNVLTSFQSIKLIMFLTASTMRPKLLMVLHFSLDKDKMPKTAVRPLCGLVSTNICTVPASPQPPHSSYMHSSTSCTHQACFNPLCMLFPLPRNSSLPSDSYFFKFQFNCYFKDNIPEPLKLNVK